MPSPPPSVAPGPVRLGLALLAGLGAAALVAATFADVVVVHVGPRTPGADTGLDRHGPALLLLAAAAIVLAILALRGSRVAGVGLVVLGLATLGIAILGDVPDLHRSGDYGGLYTSATTAAGAGFYLETLAGALMVLGGAGLWLSAPTLSGAASAPSAGDQRPSRPPRQT